MAECGRASREDPRITRTRKLIRDALETIIDQKPFSEISVQDIAERATINRATFYAHFNDKYALLEDLVRANYCAALLEHDPLSAPDISTLLRTIALNTFRLVGAHRKSKLDKSFELQVERVLQDELYRFVLPALGEAAALVVSSAVIGTTMQWRACKYREAPNELVERLVTVLSRGVRMTKIRVA